MSANDRPDVVKFVDDEAGYLNWLESNPKGFVVNSLRKPTPNYLMLHRSTCRTINTPNRANWTNAGLIKTCSLQVERLVAWAQDAVKGVLQPCAFCKPTTEDIGDVSAHGGETLPLATHRKALLKQQSSANTLGESARIPEEISTGCPQLDLAWKTYAQFVLESPILIPDTEDDLNWHAFLGHAFDMQGFRAAEFVGVDALTRRAEGFVPLRQLGIGIAELGSLWQIDAIQRQLLSRPKGETLTSTFAAVAEHGGETGEKLADAFTKFGRCRFPSTVRALLQNCAALKPHDYSFRNWLRAEFEQLGVTQFPPSDFRAATRLKSLSIEMALVERLQSAFYQVGPALAPYMLCDWQLWLWNEGRTAVFYNFKLDSFHQEFVERFGGGKIPADEAGFTQWWVSLYPELPPRLTNECIWLGMENGLFG